MLVAMGVWTEQGIGLRSWTHGIKLGHKIAIRSDLFV